MKKLFVMVPLLLVSPHLFSMIQFTDPDKGVIIAIKTKIHIAIDNALNATEETQLLNQNFYNLETCISSMQDKNNEIAQLLTEENEVGYTYIQLNEHETSTNLLKTLKDNPYVKHYLPYNSQPEKFSIIARHLQYKRNHAKKWACMAGCLTSSIAMGVAVAITAISLSVTQ